MANNIQLMFNRGRQVLLLEEIEAVLQTNCEDHSHRCLPCHTCDDRLAQFPAAARYYARLEFPLRLYFWPLEYNSYIFGLSNVLQQCWAKNRVRL